MSKEHEDAGEDVDADFAETLDARSRPIITKFVDGKLVRVTPVVDPALEIKKRRK
jgi:hypothetical protein